MPEIDYHTSEDAGKLGTITTVEQARAAHHLASADPETDGTLTGPEHDAKYGLARAAGSRSDWALAHDGDPDAGRDGGVLETVDAPAPAETATPPAPAPAAAPAAAPVATEAA